LSKGGKLTREQKMTGDPSREGENTFGEDSDTKKVSQKIIRSASTGESLGKGNLGRGSPQYKHVRQTRGSNQVENYRGSSSCPHKNQWRGRKGKLTQRRQKRTNLKTQPQSR